MCEKNQKKKIEVTDKMIEAAIRVADDEALLGEYDFPDPWLRKSTFKNVLEAAFSHLED